MKKQSIAIIVILAIIGSMSIALADKESTNHVQDSLKENEINAINNAEEQSNSGHYIIIHAFEKLYQ